MSEGRRERKVVSILFADLVGFTSRAESLDPEDVEAILRPYHDRLRAELERRGGTVEKFIGDAVMAVFGAPIAHEDDPERAVRAALAIRDWIREEGELEVRVAVNTGEALVSVELSPGAERGLVAGDVVNTASRLQSAAPVNGILVGETTYHATSRTIKYADAPAVEAKGKAEPVRVWEVIEARSRYGSDVVHRPTTPLVGREQELELLVGALARVRRERSPQLVTLAGVPGIGKSRLVYELFSAIERVPDLIYWRQGRCLPYGDGVAFWALGEILKAHAGIFEGEAAEQADEKLRAVVDEAIPDAGDAEWVVHQLRPLVGLAESGESGGDQRAETFAAWRRFFEGLAELDPLVLVFEDLHWADEGLLEFVDHLVDWASTVPILVVATARPELLTRRPDWGGGKSNATTISLSPLTEQETATLVHGLLERAVLPADVLTALLDRAGGNPLYAEEFARIVLERGVFAGRATDLPMPESVQGLIAARLDALTDDEKSLIQDASVIGKVFWLGATAALSGDDDRRSLEERLHRLERKQFIRRERRSSVEGDTEYSFAHTLVRDVAYGQIPRAERAEKHRRAAAWIESLGRADEYAELRAHHYASALDTARAGGQDTEALARAARLALREAGDRAASLNAFAAAARHYDRALELWPEDADRPRLLLAAAGARFELEFANDEELAAARDALLATGDREGAAEAEIRLVNVHWLRARGDEVLRHLERAAALAEPLPPSAEKAFVYSMISRFHMLANRDEAARAFGEEALGMAEELGVEGVRAEMLNTLGAISCGEGDRRGLRQLEESIAILERLNSPGLNRAYNNLLFSLFRFGEFEGMDEVIARHLAASERVGSVEWLRWARGRQLDYVYLVGRWDEAVKIISDLLAGLAEGEQHYSEEVWRTCRSRIRLARGDEAGADEDAAVAVERARVAGDPQSTVPSLAWRARQLLSSDRAGSEAAADELLSVCRTISGEIAHIWLADAAVALTALGREADFDELVERFRVPTPWRDGGIALARGEYARAAEIFAAMGAIPNEAEAALLGARAGVDADLSKAMEFFRDVGASAYLAEAESLLAKSRSA
jgi:class 3 adenylate cyclase